MNEASIYMQIYTGGLGLGAIYLLLFIGLFPIHILRSAYIHYQRYTSAIIEGEKLPTFDLAEWGFYNKYFTRGSNPINPAGDDAPLVIWILLGSFAWPLVLIWELPRRAHRLILYIIRRKYKAALLLHPDQDARKKVK